MRAVVPSEAGAVAARGTRREWETVFRVCV